MTIEQIKKAVDNGEKVYWENGSYQVIKDDMGQYLIHCTINNNYIGLTHKDGETLNGNSRAFFIGAF